METETLAVMIPIIAIVMGMGTAIVAIYFGYRKRTEMFKLYHQERMAAIDKGVELPPIPDSFFASAYTSSPRRDLLKGLIWLFLGVGITVTLYANLHSKKALYGLLPLGIGLAYLIYYMAEGRKRLTEGENPKTNTESRDLPQRITQN